MQCGIPTPNFGIHVVLQPLVAALFDSAGSDNNNNNNNNTTIYKAP